MNQRPTLIRMRNGVYYLDPEHLEREIELAMNPAPVRPSMPLKEVGYALLMVPVGLGILMGMLVGCVLVSGRGLMGKIWRAMK